MFDKVIVKFKEEQLSYEEKIDVLTDGVCKGILPISIMKKGSEITGFYSTAGYKRIAECKILEADKVLTVVEKTISAMEECNQYLIFPEEFVLDINTVYIKENFENIKFTYVPDRNRIKAEKKLSCFIRDLKSLTTDNGRLYLEMLGQMADTENLSITKMKAFVFQLKREVNLCEIH